MSKEPNDRRGIGSVDTAVTILRVFADAPGPLSLSEISSRTGMAASKLHRYLASLVAQGMLEQKERSGRYDLGPFAAEMGLSALARNDFVNRTADVLPDLVEETGLTAMLSVWGSVGPVIVRWERARNHIVTTLGLGTAMPLLRSATGRVFLAYAPPLMVGNLIEEPEQAAASEIATAVRDAGYAWVGGDFIPGLHALCAPVLNWQGEVETAVTLISTDSRLTEPNGPFVPTLLAACRSVSLPPKG